MTLSGVGFSGSGCGDLTKTKLEAEGIRQSETCAVPDFAMATHEASPFSGHGEQVGKQQSNVFFDA